MGNTGHLGDTQLSPARVELLAREVLEGAPISDCDKIALRIQTSHLSASILQTSGDKWSEG